jgi:membrane protein
MKERGKKPINLVQHLYVTWNTFVANDLFTYASAGAYSFLLSALPIVLMVLAILIRVVHASPDLILDLLGGKSLLFDSVDITNLLDSIMSIRSIGLFEVILGVSIFWMARSFFASIQQSMRIIYRKRGKVKPVKENLVVIAGEVILIILIVMAVVLMTARNAIFNAFLLDSQVSPFVLKTLKNTFAYAPFAIVFTFLYPVYYITPRTRPRPFQSLGAAAACTLSFAVVQLCFSAFVNMTRYNLVYGFLSNVIVILAEVFLFFVLFLFFAQFQYVSQFFESYLLAELYLLPRHDDPDPIRQLERMMFIEPPLFYTRYAVAKKPGDVLFRVGDDSTELYYVWKGEVRLSTANRILDLVRGTVFGELSSIIGGNRTETAVVLTDAILLKIPSHIFQETIEVDGKISRKTLQTVADYVQKNNRMPPFS